MLDMETELKLLFPVVMRYKPNETRFVGVFKTQQNENVFASFNVPNYPDSLGITFETGINIDEASYQSLISKSDKINFLEFLKLFSQVVGSVPKQRIFNRKFFTKFYHEFRDLKLLNRAEKFTFDSKNETLTIVHTDEFCVDNEIIIKLNFYDEYSQMYEVVKNSFPVTKDLKLFHKQCSLYLIHKQFLNFVKGLGQFHDTMQRIDSVCWVIAPSNATFQHDHRIIIIGENNISMKVTFNPWKMSEIPDFKFFGPSDVVQQYKENLSENISTWDSEGDVLQNILKVLELPFFPVREATATTSTADLVLYDSDAECCVCFSLLLDNQPPDLRCDNVSCARYFHQDCLYEWLSRLPNNVYFSSISGPCPNCEKTISCKVPEKGHDN